MEFTRDTPTRLALAVSIGDPRVAAMSALVRAASGQVSWRTVVGQPARFLTPSGFLEQEASWLNFQ